MYLKTARLIASLFFVFFATTSAQAVTLTKGDILVAGATGILRVAPLTGIRTIVSGIVSGFPAVGTGLPLSNPREITINDNGDVLVVIPNPGSLVRIDPNTGNRNVVSGCADSSCSSLIGGGPAFTPGVWSVRVEVDGNILVMDRRASNKSTLFRVDPVTGNRTVVSSDTVGSDAPNQLGAGFGIAGRIEVEQNNDILVFGDQFFTLYRVDPTTGDRSVVSMSSELVGVAGAIGSGADFGGTIALGLEESGNILALAATSGGSSAANPVKGIIRINPVSGDRTLLSGCNTTNITPITCLSVVGTGVMFQDIRGMASEPTGNIIVSDRNLGVVRVNSITGERVIVSANPTSFFFGGAIAIVPEPPPARQFDLTHTLNDPTPSGQDQFGVSVSIDGNNVLVGAWGDDTNGTNRGQAHLFNATTGTLLQTFTDPTPTSSDFFGFSVSVDGNQVLIGAWGDDTNGTNRGQAHLFNATTGTLLQTFTDPTPTSADQFGIAVSVNGNHVLIGDANDDTNGPLVGQAHLFNATTGALLHTFNDPTPTDRDVFGNSVAVDGNFVVIAAQGDDTNGINVGQVHLFDATTGMLLRTFDDPTPTDGDTFGNQVSISGNLVLIGAQTDDTNALNGGQAHLFDAVTGTLLHTFNDPTPVAENLFGNSVSVDGNLVLIAAPLSNTSGQAHLFDATTGALLQTFDDPTPTVTERFGKELAISGNNLVIAALRDDTKGFNVGQAHLYTENLAPTANAGSDQSIRANDTVFLNGTGSFDDNTASGSLLYSWNLTSLPAGSSAMLSGANTATPSFVADIEGTYSVELVVTDEGGLPSPADEVEISSDNLAPTADAGGDVLVLVGTTVNLDGRDSTDPEEDTLSYSWSVTSAPAGNNAGLVGANTATPSITPDTIGQYVVALTVSDFLGAGTTDTLAITVATAEDFANVQTVAADVIIGDLEPGEVTTGGNQNALQNFLSQAVLAIGNGDIATAIDKLEKAIARTDGCINNDPPAPDGSGPGRDWVTDCGAQTEIYPLLTDALNALQGV